MSEDLKARNDRYRYFVGDHAANLTPMASIDLYLGNKKVSVINISLGGLALILPEESIAHLDPGDPVDVSISIRERAFPMQLEIKNRDETGRANCSFLNPSPAFTAALKEFLGPKYLGASIVRNDQHSNIQEALDLVDGAERYEAYTGANQTGIFVWMNGQGILLKLLAVSRDLVLSWTPGEGLQTGKIQSQGQVQDEDINWDRVMEFTVYNYIADILLAWCGEKSKQEWLENLFEATPGSDEAKNIHFTFED